MEWVSDCIDHLRQREYVRIEATPEAEAGWAEQIEKLSVDNILTKTNSWFVGANIPGKARVLLGSPDSAPVMRTKRAEAAANGYDGFLLQ